MACAALASSAGICARVCSTAVRACSTSSCVTSPASARHCTICSVWRWLARLSRAIASRACVPRSCSRFSATSAAMATRVAPSVAALATAPASAARPPAAAPAHRSASQLASTPSRYCWLVLPPSLRLACAELLPPTDSVRPAAARSCCARAWRSRARAAAMSVLPASACSTNGDSAGSSKRRHHRASAAASAAGAAADAPVQASGGCSGATAGPACCSDAQPARTQQTIDDASHFMA